jgi:hypothetical protein
MEVDGYGQLDRRAAEWGNVPPLERLRLKREDFIVEVRRGIRVRNAKAVFTEAELDSERRRRGGTAG